MEVADDSARVFEREFSIELDTVGGEGAIHTVDRTLPGHARRARRATKRIVSVRSSRACAPAFGSSKAQRGVRALRGRGRAVPADGGRRVRGGGGRFRLT